MALSDKTNAELREICDAAGITGVSKKTKAQLIALLQEMDTAGSTDDEDTAS